MSGRKGMKHRQSYDGRLRFARSLRKSILRAISRADTSSNANVREYLGLGDDKSNHVSCELRRLRHMRLIARTGYAAYRITALGSLALRDPPRSPP